MSEPRDTAWLGNLKMADDHCLLIGTPGRTSVHAHYAHQLLVAQGGELCVDVAGSARQGALLAIESLQPHAVVSHNVPCITLFAEPLAFDLATLVELCHQANGDAERLAELLRDCPRRPLDPRLAKALARVRAIDEHTLPAQALAREAALSLSQLERLCSGRLGLSVRRLVLWQRLRLALQHALGASSLTEAAMAAGFADSAHLSRCLRQQFGIRASEALRQLQLGAFV